MRNEGAFLLEWVAWYRMLGFTDIVVFQNDSFDNTERSLMALRDMGVMDSIRHGWQVVRAHLGEIILLGLAFFLVGIIILIIAAAIIAPIVLLVGVPMVALMESNATFLQGLLAVLGIVLGLIVFALISAITISHASRSTRLGSPAATQSLCCGCMPGTGSSAFPTR